jgi:hypothetical protein
MDRRALRRWRRELDERTRGPIRWLRLDEGRGALLLLALSTVVLGACVAGFGASTVPTAALVLPIILGVLSLRLRQLRLLLAASAVMTVIVYSTNDVNDARIGVLLLLIVVAVVSYYTVAMREGLGIVGTRGDSMLGDLRARLLAAARLARLPAGWHVEVASRVSGGSAFGGDFVVSCADGDSWEVVLVDVSGKGVNAGTRALQLSGALGGLLGAVPPEEFLEKANQYLLRQNWREGFATAVHLALDVRTGAYVLRSAGHPPAARFTAGDGAWSLADAEGPVLGLLPDATYIAASGTLLGGDALLLYTDGLVEIPGRDLSLGIDKLLGEATRLVINGFAGGGERLLRQVAPGATDDRAVLVLWRS